MESVEVKGALVAARRLDATHLPEFRSLAEKYRALRRLPDGWDVHQMAQERGAM